MRFFKEEDNKKLYESELPDTLKNFIANFNEIIICYIKEKFQGYEGLDEFLEEIKENYKNINFKLVKDKYSDSYASYIHTENTFEINEEALELFTVEQGFLAIYFHEFSHFISSIKNKNKTKRKEEGIADLFSDELVDYFNKTFEEKNIIQKKESTYKKASSIIRNACFINNNTKDLLWDYYQNNQEKTKEFFKKAYGIEATKLIYEIEKYSNNPNYISKKEEEYILSALKNKNIEESEEIYIRLNTLLQKCISEKLLKDNYSLEQAKEKYKQIPKEFYDNYEIMFSNVNTKKQEIINKNEINEEEIDALAHTFLEYINIKQYENPNKKIGLYNEIEASLPINLSKYNDIFALNATILIPIIHAYKLKYNNKQYSKKELIEIIKRLGFSEILNQKTINRILELGEINYKEFNNLSKEECFEKIKKIIKNQIKDLTKKDFYINQLKNKKIDINQFMDIMINEYNKSLDNIYDPVSYITSIIQEYTKTQKQELNTETFNQVKQVIEEKIKKTNAPYIPSITGNILSSWDIDKISIYNALEIISKNDIGTNIKSETFEDIRIEGIIQLSKENNLNNIIKCVNTIINSEYENYPFFYKKNGNSISKIESIKNLENEIFKKIEESSKQNDEILKQKVENDDNALIKFYKYRYQTPLKEEDKIIIKQITGITNDSNMITDYIGYKFNKELYIKLKQYPHLALTYMGFFQPSAHLTIFDAYNTLNKYNSEEYPYLKEENKKLFIELVKEINKGYEIKEYELKNITYELKLLSKIPYNILDEENEKKFALELLNICNKKIDYTLNSSKENIEQLKNTLKENIEIIKNEYLKNELEKIYKKIENNFLEEKTK